MSAQEYFRRTWILADEVAALVCRVEELETVCGRMTMQVDPTGRMGGGSGGAKDNALAALADLRSACREKKRELADVEREVEQVCETLSGRDGLVLRYRYVQRLSWLEIRAAMQRKGYACATLRTVYRWHRTALLRTERLLREETP